MRRPGTRRVVAPGVAAVLLAVAIALLQLEKLPTWLAWCPPWLAAVLVAVLGAAVVVVERWSARRYAEVDGERPAVERLRQHAGRHGVVFPRIGQVPATALALRVHPAITLPVAAPDELPLFVERDLGAEVRDWMRGARDSGGFLVLVGDSCVGKTRLLYEAARQELPDFAVLAPDVGDGDLVNIVAGATFPLPRLIIWLDELQRFLPGPYLTDRSTPLRASTIRHLLEAPTPIVIVGTLWPSHAATLRDADSDPSTGEQRPRYPEAVDLLTDRRVREIRLYSFSPTERATARDLAVRDPRIAAALADRHYNVTEALAGAPELIARYERGTNEQRAILHAAADARRVGIQGPLSEDLLRAAGRAYLTTVHPDDVWFQTALRELTRHERAQDRATAPLLPLAGPDHRSIVGYGVADYLLQQLTRHRRAEPLPALAWQAVGEHTHAHEDLVRLADNAERRMVYDQALAAYRRLSEGGDGQAAQRFFDLLTRLGRIDDAVPVLRTRAKAGDDAAVRQLIDLLSNRRHTRAAVAGLLGVAATADPRSAEQEPHDEVVAELRELTEAGNRYAAGQLASMLEWRGRLDEAIEVVRGLASDGDWHYSWQLVRLLSRRDRTDEAAAVLSGLAAAGDRYAIDELTDRLVEQGRTGDAVAALRPLAADGHRQAIRRLVDLLVDDGHTGDAAQVLGAPVRGRQLADHLTRWGHTGEGLALLRALAGAGDREAGGHLAALLSARAYGGTPPATDPHRAPAWLADLLSRQGDPEAAVGALRAVADAGDSSAAWWLSDLLAVRGRAPEAADLLRPLAEAGDLDAVQERQALGRLADPPGAPAADARETRRLTGLLIKQGRTTDLPPPADDEAADRLTLMESAHELRALADGGAPEAAWWSADLMARQGNVDDAAAVLRGLVAAGHRYAGARLAELLTGQGKLDELLDRAGAGDRDAGWGAADLLARQGNKDAAAEVLRRVADTGDAYAARHLADLLVELGRPSEAIQVLRGRAVARHPVAARHLAGLLATQGRGDEAVPVLRRLADTGDLSAARLLADLLADLGDADGAVRVLTAPAALRDPRTARHRAVLLARLGRIAEAANALRERLPDAIASSLWSEMGRRNPAFHTLIAVEAEARSEVRRRAELLVKQERTEDAVEVLRAGADAGDPDAARYLIDLLHSSGMIDELRAEVNAGTPGAAERLLKTTDPPDT